MRRLALVALTAALGCSSKDSSPTSSNASIVGTWNLTAANNAALPFVVTQAGADKVEMTADQLTFLKSGQFTQLTSMRTTTNGTTTTQQVPQAGTFSASGGSVVMQFTGVDAQYNGSVAGTTFTLNLQGIVLTYSKQ